MHLRRLSAEFTQTHELARCLARKSLEKLAEWRSALPAVLFRCRSHAHFRDVVVAVTAANQYPRCGRGATGSIATGLLGTSGAFGVTILTAWSENAL